MWRSGWPNAAWRSIRAPFTVECRASYPSWGKPFVRADDRSAIAAMRTIRTAACRDAGSVRAAPSIRTARWSPCISTSGVASGLLRPSSGRATATTGVVPGCTITDKARCYPPALRGLHLAVQHRRSRYLNNALERDHSHLKQRMRSMRGFKHLPAADVVSRGHALVQNLRNGFSTLTVAIPCPLRLATACPQLAYAI